MRAIRYVAIAVAALSSLECFSLERISVDARIPTITIHARRYEFEPSEIVLQQGHKVKLVFISDDVSHGIAIDDLAIAVEFAKGHPKQIIVNPSTAGTFEGECSRYCGTGHDRMKLVVHVAR